MTTAAPSTALATIQPVFTDAERAALAGFLAGYRGLAREAYTLALRQFANWCRVRSTALFAVRRADIEASPASWRRWAAPGPPSPSGCPPSPGSTGTPSKKSSWTAHPPPTCAVRESTTSPRRRAGPQRARRATRRRRARAASRARADLSACAERAAGVGDRTDGPLFLARDGPWLDRHRAGRIVRTTARRAGIAKVVTPHTLRHAFITAALDAGVPLRDVQEAASHADPQTTMRHDRARGSLDGTRPISSPPTSPVPPGRQVSWKELRPAAVAGRSHPRLPDSNDYAVVAHRDLSANANRLLVGRLAVGLVAWGCSRIRVIWVARGRLARRSYMRAERGVVAVAMSRSAVLAHGRE
jgi:hypothetical protein